MGDPLQSWASSSSSSYRSSSLFVASSSPSSSRISSSLVLPGPSPIPFDSELWRIAEQRVQEIICTIQPLAVSDRGRERVIGYLQKLIRERYGVEAIPFGSSPLKTYLPDGDIDLTVLSKVEMVENLVTGIYGVLLQEQKKVNPDCQINNVDHIHAQVKVVKCDVMNISVDISFNQMEGLCALCFFEQVDQYIGKDHLFKRSIILIKAWCYYESRILGSHCGLFSTYAIQILVLYIINLSYPTLCGPLSVLYKFLEYYGGFDWDNYCVSVSGPVPITSLQNGLVEPVNATRDDLFLGRDFLEYCKWLYSIPIRAVEVINERFPGKFLNIIDPLKENNNLGRSVSKGNAQRIRCALSAGARKLREVLVLPGESMGMGIEGFFVNTLERNGMGQRHDLESPINAFGTGKTGASELGGNFYLYYNVLLSGQRYHGYTMPNLSQPVHQPPPDSHFQNTNPWNLAQQPMFTPMNVNMFAPVSLFPYPLMQQDVAVYIPYWNLPPSRGTGTFIPDASHYVNRDRGATFRRRRHQRSNSRSVLGSPEWRQRTENPSETSNARTNNMVNSINEIPATVTTSQLARESAPATIQANLGNSNLKCAEASTSLSARPSTSKNKAVAGASSSSSVSKNVKEEYIPATVTTSEPSKEVHKLAPSPSAPDTIQSNLGNTNFKCSEALTSLFAQSSTSKNEADSGASSSSSVSLTAKKKSSSRLYKLEDQNDFPPLTAC